MRIDYDKIDTRRNNGWGQLNVEERMTEGVKAGT
jgi:hypothetical protein